MEEERTGKNNVHKGKNGFKDLVWGSYTILHVN